MSFKLGKQPATYDHRDLTWADIRPKYLHTVLPPIPKVGGGYGSLFQDWLMLGNGPDDTVFPGFGGCGDCAWAGPAHETMEEAKNAKRPVPKFSGRTIVEQYSEYSGYDPQSGANDNGSNVRDVLNWRQSKGLRDDHNNVYKIGPYLSIEPGNFQHLWECLWLFEKVGIGFQFPQSAMDQFNNNNQIWSVVPGSPVEGGHYVPIVGHPTTNIWTAVSWALRQTMTPGFITKYNDEAWTYIDPIQYNAVTGETPQHWKDFDLQKFIAELLKQIPQQ